MDAEQLSARACVLSPDVMQRLGSALEQHRGSLARQLGFDKNASVQQELLAWSRNSGSTIFVLTNVLERLGLSHCVSLVERDIDQYLMHLYVAVESQGQPGHSMSAQFRPVLTNSAFSLRRALEGYLDCWGDPAQHFQIVGPGAWVAWDMPASKLRGQQLTLSYKQEPDYSIYVNADESTQLSSQTQLKAVCYATDPGSSHVSQTQLKAVHQDAGGDFDESSKLKSGHQKTSKEFVPHSQTHPKILEYATDEDGSHNSETEMKVRHNSMEPKQLEDSTTYHKQIEDSTTYHKQLEDSTTYQKLRVLEEDASLRDNQTKLKQVDDSFENQPNGYDTCQAEDSPRLGIPESVITHAPNTYELMSPDTLHTDSFFPIQQHQGLISTATTAATTNCKLSMCRGNIEQDMLDTKTLPDKFVHGQTSKREEAHHISAPAVPRRDHGEGGSQGDCGPTNLPNLSLLDETSSTNDWAAIHQTEQKQSRGALLKQNNLNSMSASTAPCLSVRNPLDSLGDELEAMPDRMRNRPEDMSPDWDNSLSNNQILGDFEDASSGIKGGHKIAGLAGEKVDNNHATSGQRSKIEEGEQDMMEISENVSSSHGNAPVLVGSEIPAAQGESREPPVKRQRPGAVLQGKQAPNHGNQTRQKDSRGREILFEHKAAHDAHIVHSARLATSELDCDMPLQHNPDVPPSSSSLHPPTGYPFYYTRYTPPPPFLEGDNASFNPPRASPTPFDHTVQAEGETNYEGAQCQFQRSTSPQRRITSPIVQVQIPPHHSRVSQACIHPLEAAGESNQPDDRIPKLPPTYRAPNSPPAYKARKSIPPTNLAHHIPPTYRAQHNSSTDTAHSSSPSKHSSQSSPHMHRAHSRTTPTHTAPNSPPTHRSQISSPQAHFIDQSMIAHPSHPNAGYLAMAAPVDQDSYRQGPAGGPHARDVTFTDIDAVVNTRSPPLPHRFTPPRQPGGQPPSPEDQSDARVSSPLHPTLSRSYPSRQPVRQPFHPAPPLPPAPLHHHTPPHRPTTHRRPSSDHWYTEPEAARQNSARGQSVRQLQEELKQLPGWCPGINGDNVQQTMSRFLHQDGVFLVWRSRRHDNFVITVTHQGKLVYLRVYEAPPRSKGGGPVYFLYKDELHTESIAALCRHYMEPNSKHGRQHTEFTRLVTPVQRGF